MSDSPRPQSITACLIVLNEEARLPAALDSVSWCDEIVVVDSLSTDRTVEIARAHGATVVENPWPGFGAQRNVAIDHATSEWILEVDADERISADLRDEIRAFLAAPPADDVMMGVLPLRDRFLGRPIGPSAKYPRYRGRLFRRAAYRHDEARMVHEGLWPRERVLAFRGDMEHELAGTWSEALRDMWSYARLESAHVGDPGSAAGYVRAIVVRPTAKVVFRLVVSGGWRDGWRGFARIGVEAVGDSLAYVRRLTGRVPRTTSTGAPLVAGEQGAPRIGPVRVVAVDRDGAAVGFLRQAYDAGADVALVTSSATDPGPWLHVERVGSLGPFAVTRALDALGQIRPVDQIVVGNARVPHALIHADARGMAPPVTMSSTSPAELVTELEKSCR